MRARVAAEMQFGVPRTENWFDWRMDEVFVELRTLLVA